MRCVLHYANPSAPASGIWWEDEAGGEVRSYYPPDHEAEKIIGSTVMLQKRDDIPWSTYFDHLEDSDPFVNGWDGVDVSEPPDSFLARVAENPALV